MNKATKSTRPTMVADIADLVSKAKRLSVGDRGWYRFRSLSELPHWSAVRNKLNKFLIDKQRDGESFSVSTSGTDITVVLLKRNMSAQERSEALNFG